MFKCLKKEILYASMNFQLRNIQILPSLLPIPLKKRTFWKVTKYTIDTENEKLSNCAKIEVEKFESTSLHLKKKHHAPTKKKKG
jgi:hypothetical protein